MQKEAYKGIQVEAVNISDINVVSCVLILSFLRSQLSGCLPKICSNACVWGFFSPYQRIDFH